MPSCSFGRDPRRQRAPGLGLQDFLPLPVLELSHFLASVTGAGLLLLAWGLQRRLDTAYLSTIALLAAGIAFSLLKGFDYEEAAILGVTLGALGRAAGSSTGRGPSSRFSR